ncbi:TPA: oxidative stress defense protein [Morganella morganii subsp. morganii]|uniref:Oxidative stress defense protein n=1 Tax=Morganella morganii TaxID=582 RepID=A0AAU8ZMI9_MORMO|nr:oxidative stress defense protein [Morganella morganii]HDU8692612.1 oxidative stress defense protein [Morganella morganii subsp. morganii]AWC94335.1 oxidative stress defense protein [Morganella morganii]EKW8485470.1 oxidative stress defense protein [Morganella morganii]HAT3623441.1 oxidative stress defense protein [Morganella morganii]HCU0877020.1 oxidative stress defense protein [Morganella morganii]
MKLKSLALAAMVALGGYTAAAQAAETPAGPHISTSGSAVIQAEPDMATLSINVTVKEKDASAAKAQADKRVAQYFDFLKAQGIEKKDINAANISTSPDYVYDKEKEESVIRGYNASRSVTVKVHDLNKLNTLLDGALKSGLNDISAVEFGVNNPEKYREEARQKAISDAISQAKSVAKGFGTELGAVYSIGYNAPQPVPVMARNKMMLAANAPAAVSADETYEQQTIDFRDQVDVVFELKR